MRQLLALSLLALTACDLEPQIVRWNVVNDAAAKAAQAQSGDDDDDVDVGMCEHFDADGVCTDVLVIAHPAPTDPADPAAPPAADEPGVDDSVPLVAAAERFKLAQEVIRDKCIDCHTNKHDSWQDWGESTYVSKGKVKIGDFANSSIIKRLQNYGGNMPKDDNKLSSDEIAALRDWIENIGKK